MPFDATPLLKWGAVAFGLVVLLVLLNVLRQIYTNWLWFDALSYRSVFTTILFTRVWLFLVGAAVFAAIVTPNAVMAYRSSVGEPAPLLSVDLYALLKRLLVWGTWATVFLISVLFGSILSGQWETVLRFLNTTPFDVQDPVFNRDVSFFVFDLPVLTLMQGWLLGAVITTMLVAGSIFLINVSLRDISLGQAITPQAVSHATILLGVLLLVITWSYWLDRYELLFSAEGAIFGAAFTDLNARLPALYILIGVGAVIGVLLLANAYFRSPRIIVGGVGLWIAVAVVVGALYPALVQRFQVAPNELDREREYIPRNIEFTRQGFALNRIEEEDYQLAVIEGGESAGELAPINAETVAANPGTIENLRLWDRRPLRSIYNQIQFFRAYYRFVGVDIDRYEVDGEIQAGGARRPRAVPGGPSGGVAVLGEPAPPVHPRFRRRNEPHNGVHRRGQTRIPHQGHPPQGRQGVSGGASSRTWRCLRFTTARTAPAMSSSTPRKTEFDFPAIDCRDSRGRGLRLRRGGGGVQLSSLLKRFAYAWEFADINLLISGAIANRKASIQYRRLVQDRVKQIAPFLRLDSDPYMVVADGKLWWIQDAYTITDHYPYSDPYREEFNYMRNSVKAVVDAYTGDVQFYIFDDEDAIIRTFSAAFPGPVQVPRRDARIAAESHVRYPRDFFSVQAEKYLLYHMRDTTDFYRKEDPWSIPQELFFETVQPIQPYHVIMKLPGEEKEEFVLMIPFTPLNKPNQVAWLAARMDNDRGQYGSLKAFFFPKGIQVDGPEQIEARIDQDFTIKQQFTLLCQRGARCIRGNLLVTPIEHEGKRFLMYVEPLYIQAENITFPELKQVILADAKSVVMADDLNSALEALLAGGEPESVTPTDPTAEPTDDMNADEIRQAIAQLKQSLDRLEQALDRLLGPTQEGGQ